MYTQTGGYLNMGRCFVIQPFDKDKFDKRFEDHFAPPILRTGLEPYRVDRDPSVRIPIESIHSGIDEADACLADITTNNPNVWYELGFALARQKEVVLVCSSERDSDFPFDVQHLNIISYSSSSGSDFVKLEQEITSHLQARLQERQNLQSIASISPVKEVHGLSPHEIATLSILFADRSGPETITSYTDIKHEMGKAGFTAIALNLSLESLQRKKMVRYEESFIEEIDQTFYGYTLDPVGIEWIMENQDYFVLRREE
jgi:hypothetical protein